jgi:SOS response regulatory protein OraA/RecX
MALPPKNAADAIRRQKTYIQQQQAKGRSLNSIRKELIQQGMRKVSRAYFNEVVSEIFTGDASVAVLKTAARPAMAEQSASPGAPKAAVTSDNSAEALPQSKYRSGNYVDDRFDNDL